MFLVNDDDKNVRIIIITKNKIQDFKGRRLRK